MHHSPRLINPLEPDHQALLQRLDVALQRRELEETDQAGTREDVDTITRMSQAIPRQAWARVRKGT